MPSISVWGFPGGLVIRIPGFHCRGPGSVPHWGTEVRQATLCSWKKTNKPEYGPGFKALTFSKWFWAEYVCLEALIVIANSKMGWGWVQDPIPHESPCQGEQENLVCLVLLHRSGQGRNQGLLGKQIVSIHWLLSQGLLEYSCPCSEESSGRQALPQLANYCSLWLQCPFSFPFFLPFPDALLIMFPGTLSHL